MIPICISAIEDESDRAFMEGLYLSYRRLMYAQLKKWLDNSWDIEDAMQTVLVKLIDKLALIRKLDRDRLAGYISAACRSTAIDLLRKKKPGQTVSFEEEPDVTAGENNRDMELRLIRADQFSALARCWPHLDERTRYLLEGYYLLEKTMGELGAELGISAGSVRMALVRARQKALKSMEEQSAEALSSTLGTDP